MMKVICKCDDNMVSLTYGKEYECLNSADEWINTEQEQLITIIDDIGEVMNAGKWRFILAENTLDKICNIHLEEEIVKELFEFIPPEQVNHPSHYTHGKYEVIDVIEDWNLGFNLGNAIKYIGRAGHKDDIVQDLEKAKWYIEREIKRLKDNECPF